MFWVSCHGVCCTAPFERSHLATKLSGTPQVHVEGLFNPILGYFKQTDLLIFLYVYHISEKCKSE